MWPLWLDAITRQTVPPPPAGADAALLAWALGLCATALVFFGARLIRRLEKTVDELAPLLKALLDIVKSEFKDAARLFGDALGLLREALALLRELRERELVAERERSEIKSCLKDLDRRLDDLEGRLPRGKP